MFTNFLSYAKFFILYKLKKILTKNHKSNQKFDTFRIKKTSKSTPIILLQKYKNRFGLVFNANGNGGLKQLNGKLK